MKSFYFSLQLIVISFLFAASAEAQPMSWAWSRSYGNTGSESVAKIATNSTSNVFAYGTFESPSLSIGSTTLTNAGSADLFLISHDTSGILGWALSFGGSGTEAVGSLSTDVNGNAVISGTFQNTITIGSTTLTSLGGKDIFVAKINTFGTVLWAKQIAGTGDDIAADLKCDAGNNIYLTGSYTSNSLAIGSTTLASGAANNVFYCRLDGNGDAVWAKKSSDATIFYLDKIGFSDPNLITFFGATSGQASLNLGAPGGPITFPTAVSTPFILRTDIAGNFVTQCVGVRVSTFTHNSSVVIAPNKDMYFAGGYTQLSDPVNHGFVLRTDENDVTKVYNGPYTLVYTGSGPSAYSSMSDIALTKNNRLFSIGGTSGNLNFGNGYTIPVGVSASFIWETDTATATNGLLSIQSTPAASGGFNSIAVDTVNNSLFVGGSFATASGEEYIVGPDTLRGNGVGDILISKISINGYNPNVSPQMIVPENIFACTGSTVTIGNPAGAVSGHPPYTYSWSPATGLADASAPYTTLTATSSQTYVLTITDAAANVLRDTVHVTVATVPATPTITANGSTTICGTGTLTLTSSTAVGNYAWSNGGATQAIVVSTSGNYSVKDSIAPGCVSAVSLPIVIIVKPRPATPTVTVTGTLPVCAGSGNSVTLTSSAVEAGGIYHWSNGAATQSINWTEDSASNFYYVQTFYDGCYSILSNSVNAYTVPSPTGLTITAGGATTFCEGGSVTLTASAAPAGHLYVWNNGAITQSITVNSSGNYTVKDSIPSGCASAASMPVTVTVNPIPAMPVITSGPLTFCVGSFTTLTANGGTTYLWSNGATTPSIVVNSTGSYTVKTSAAGCNSLPSLPAVTTAVPVPATPSINATGSLTLCAGNSVTLSYPAGHNYFWSTGAGTPTISVNTAGSYTLQDSIPGCKSLVSAPAVVTVVPLPAIPTITQSGNVLTSSAANGNQWYYNGTIITGATGNQFTYSLPGDYTVTVTDANSCSSSSNDYAASFVNGSITILRTGEPFLHFLSPNPAQSNSSVNFNLKSAAKMTIAIMGENGFKVAELIKDQNMAAGDHRVPLATGFYKMRSGVYIITYFINGEKVTDKIVVVK